MASSRPLTGRMGSSGPNISSCITFDSGVTFFRTVGAKQNKKSPFVEQFRLSYMTGVLFTYVAVWLIAVSPHGDGAVFQHGHYPLEVALVDDATIVRAGLWVVCVELLLEQTVFSQKYILYAILFFHLLYAGVIKIKLRCDVMASSSSCY